MAFTDSMLILKFERTDFEYLQNKTGLKRIFLMDPILLEIKTNPDLWKDIIDWSIVYNVDGFGMNKDAIATKNETNHINGTNPMFIEDAHAIKKQIHVWTFRNEYMHLAWNYGQDPYTEYDFFLSMNIDGYLTDFSRTARRFLQWKERVVSKREL